MATDLSKLEPLVDTDSLIYRAGFSADASVIKDLMETLGCDKEKAEELALEEDYLVHALGNLKQMLQDSVRHFNKDKAKFYLTGVGNYREQIATLAPYKGNRKQRKPKYFKELRGYAESVWGAEVVDGMEADDIVSIEQWQRKDRGTIIVGLDKDLWNTPGHHWAFHKDEYSYVTRPEADLNFWMQVAMGDATDNVKGLAKIGPKTAQKEWDKHRDIIQFQDWVKRMYDKQFQDEGPFALHETATLVWIQRDPWINYDGSNIRGAV